MYVGPGPPLRFKLARNLQGYNHGDVGQAFVNINVLIVMMEIEGLEGLVVHQKLQDSVRIRDQVFFLP